MDDDPNGDDSAGAEESPPLQDLVDRIQSADAGSGEPERGVPHGSDVDSTDLFDDESTGEIATEAVWEAIESDWPDAGELTDFQNSETEHVVPKRWYCEQCEHFSKPPEVHCTHPDTTILEFVGTENVRVRNCPVVAERKALGQFQTD